MGINSVHAHGYHRQEQSIKMYPTMYPTRYEALEMHGTGTSGIQLSRVLSHDNFKAQDTKETETFLRPPFFGNFCRYLSSPREQYIAHIDEGAITYICM